ncbi:MAG: hypothetical protein AAF639_16890 [Chloroflexota bacterium]
MGTVQPIVSIPEISKTLRQARARAVSAKRIDELKSNPNLRIPFTDEELIKRGVFDAESSKNIHRYYGFIKR